MVQFQGSALNVEFYRFTMKIGYQSQNDDAKTCASTLHAVHVKGTYIIVALATAINRVFLIIASLLRANFYAVAIKLDI